MPKSPHQMRPERLARAISRLPAIEREILLLSARDGLRSDEIAARLMIPTEAARARLADALYHLDRDLERRARSWWKLW